MCLSTLSTTSCQPFYSTPQLTIVKNSTPIQIEYRDFKCVDYRDYIEDFTWKLECQVRQSNSNASLDSLRMLFKTTRSSDLTIQRALYKKDSYLTRLFSGESWSQWWESRSPLGKVASVFQQYLYQRGWREASLDPMTILNANEEAKKLLGKNRQKNPRELENYESKLKKLNAEIVEFHQEYSPEQIIRFIVEGHYSSNFDLIQPTTVEKLRKLMDRANKISNLRCEPTHVHFVEIFVIRNSQFNEFYSTYSSRRDLLSQIEEINDSLDEKQSYFAACKEITDACNQLISSDNPFAVAKEMYDSFNKNNRKLVNEYRESRYTAEKKIETLESQISTLSEEILFDLPNNISDESLLKLMKKFNNPKYTQKVQLKSELDENKKILLDSMTKLTVMTMKNSLFLNLPFYDEKNLKIFAGNVLNNLNQIEFRKQEMDELKIKKEELESSLR